MRRRRFRNAPGIILFLSLIGLLGYFLGWSKVLEIRSIEISAAGNEALITPVIVPKDLHIGLPMARLSTQRITHDLAGMTWIAKIRINRRWLAHDVRITISEHRAIAKYFDNSGMTRYFDSQGYSFVSPNPPSGIPVISFGDQGDASRAAVATFLSQTPTDLTANLISLSVDSADQIALATKLPGFPELEIHWGNESDIALKVKVLRQLLVLPENGKVTMVDLSNPLTPVVR
jgi:cell division septal protein FtsQ